MPGEFFDEALRRFIAEHIDSVETLEILLLLNANPGEVWTVDGVFKVIKSNPASIHVRLKRLHQMGFLRLDEQGRYCYNASDGSVELVAKLALAYHQSRVRVLETVFSDSMDQARTFAALVPDQKN
ncbi:MAG: hypothetical protein U1G07_13260 [Verrucomicrobiota bacterium]